MEFTSLQGRVTTTYKELVKVFGMPTYGPNDLGDKVTCEWELSYMDRGKSKKATIYDWKVDQTPIHEYSWHIGGNDLSAVDHVTGLLHSFYKM